jgi:hypothetical protein
MRARTTGGARPLPVAAAVVAVALASALGGCGGAGGPATDGPLSSGNGANDPIPRGAICAPGGRPQAFGDQQFTNYGDTTVVLDRVVLLRPHNERLVGSYAVPGAVLIGTVHWPPNYTGLPPTWKDRQRVHGYRLAAGKTFNMVLGVAAVTSGRRATSAGMAVYYHDSSGTFVAKNYFANIIAANTHTC